MTSARKAMWPKFNCSDFSDNPSALSKNAIRCDMTRDNAELGRWFAVKAPNSGRICCAHAGRIQHRRRLLRECQFARFASARPDDHIFSRL